MNHLQDQLFTLNNYVVIMDSSKDSFTARSDAVFARIGGGAEEWRIRVDKSPRSHKRKRSTSSPRIEGEGEAGYGDDDTDEEEDEEDLPYNAAIIQRRQRTAFMGDSFAVLDDKIVRISKRARARFEAELDEEACDRMAMGEDLYEDIVVPHHHQGEEEEEEEEEEEDNDDDEEKEEKEEEKGEEEERVDSKITC